MYENENNIPIIESLILSSPEPLSGRKISEVVDNLNNGDIDEIIDILNRRYSENDNSFRIRKIAGGYQVYIVESYARYVEDLLARRRSIRLTRAALETLAIIAYRQPVTKTDIEMIRGVASDSVIHTLLQRKLVTMAGRADTVGRPLLYKTTDEFLKFFNLNTLNDLPRMKEIEELLASGDPDTQPTLPLGMEDETLPASNAQDDTGESTGNDDTSEGIPVPPVELEDTIDTVEPETEIPTDTDIDHTTEEQPATAFVSEPTEINEPEADGEEIPVPPVYYDDENEASDLTEPIRTGTDNNSTDNETLPEEVESVDEPKY